MKRFIGLLLVAVFLVAGCRPALAPTPVPPKKVTLRAPLAGPKPRWDLLLPLAMEELQKRHPDMELDIEYEVLPYAKTREKLLAMMAAKTPNDLVSVDCIWLGEFAEGGFLEDITDRVEEWGRMDEWFEENRKGSTYKDRYYGIWSWTDARVMWYWKDLLEEAGVSPDDLKTWDGYIASCKKLNETCRPKGIEGCHLVGAPHSPDMWFPYLWMLGGEILTTKEGKWYPAYHGPEGVRALTFLKDQVDAGIKPQTEHTWGVEFADKKFAVMLEGSWLLGKFPEEEKPTLEEKIGMIPMFPVPEAGMDTSTMMGGWVLSIPATSEHKDLAWELLTIIEEPDILVEMLSGFAYLPTQRTIAEEEPYASKMAEVIPFFEELVSVLPYGRNRPNIAEYPELAEQMRVAIEEVYYGRKTPADPWLMQLRNQPRHWGGRQSPPMLARLWWLDFTHISSRERNLGIEGDDLRCGKI